MLKDEQLWCNYINELYFNKSAGRPLPNLNKRDYHTLTQYLCDSIKGLRPNDFCDYEEDSKEFNLSGVKNIRVTMEDITDNKVRWISIRLLNKKHTSFYNITIYSDMLDLKLIEQTLDKKYKTMGPEIEVYLFIETIINLLERFKKSRNL